MSYYIGGEKMKKVLAIVMLIIMAMIILSCQNNDTIQTNSGPTETDYETESFSNSSSTTIDKSTPEETTYINSKEDILNKWSGKTINVLTTNYIPSSQNPWSQVEIDSGKFGEKMVSSQNNRQSMIQKTYGVNVNWISSDNYQSIYQDIEKAVSSNDVTYEIVFVRTSELFTMASYMLDLGNNIYIDFTQDYYSQEAYKMFTLYGHTLYAEGDFCITNNENSEVLMFNKKLLNEIASESNIYDDVKNGKWTYEKMVSLARNAYSDDGDGVVNDFDTFGLSCTSFDRTLYRSFGVYGVKPSGDNGYEITEAKYDDRINSALSILRSLRSNEYNWARLSWGGNYGSNAQEAFKDGRVLFYSDVVQQLNSFYDLSFDMGVLPLPKYDEEQDRYYVTQTPMRSLFVGVPECTSDKEMSYYFLDVLSWSERDYLKEHYLEYKSKVFSRDTRDIDIDILEHYIFANKMYDVASFGTIPMFGEIETGNRPIESIRNNDDYIVTIERMNAPWKNYEK